MRLNIPKRMAIIRQSLSFSDTTEIVSRTRKTLRRRSNVEKLSIEYDPSLSVKSLWRGEFLELDRPLTRYKISIGLITTEQVEAALRHRARGLFRS